MDKEKAKCYDSQGHQNTTHCVSSPETRQPYLTSSPSYPNLGRECPRPRTRDLKKEQKKKKITMLKPKITLVL